MKLTKQQRAIMGRNAERAAVQALRGYFMGQGAGARRLQFALDVLKASARWTSWFVLGGSWAVIAGLLFGPEHDFFLTGLRSWMVSLPPEVVLVRTHSLFVAALWSCAKYGAFFGVVLKVSAIIKPAMNEAKSQYIATLA